VLEFKSYAQGLGSMKAVSIGGYWFNEEVPYHLVFEVQGRCRDYDSPGWADFTPVECKTPAWIDAYATPPEGWRFYHLNTHCNKSIAARWAERYLATVPAEMQEMRTIGKFTTLRGAVYKEFRRAIHVTPPFAIPKAWRRLRGIDFGYVNPFVCLWVARDNEGRYYVYDEYYSPETLLEERVKAMRRRQPWGTEPWHGPTYTDHDAQWRKELEARGISCTPAKKDIQHGIAHLRSLMKPADDGRPRLFVFDHCKNLIREIMGYRWPEGTDHSNPKEAPLDKNNDTLDALRYAIYSDQFGEYDRTPEGRRSVQDTRRHGVLFRKRY
jgi:hypothetical protein